METKHDFLDLQDQEPLYPKCKYKGSVKNPEGIVVHSAEEEKALGKGWRDHPDPAFCVKPNGDTQ